MAVLNTLDEIEITPGTDLFIPVYRYAETQVLTLVGSPTGGTFIARYRNVATTAIAYDATGATLQTALEAVSTLGPGNVTASGAAEGPWTVAPARLIDVKTFLKNPLSVTASLTGGTNPHITVDLPLADVSARAYELQVRDEAGTATADIWINSDGDPNPATSTVQGEIDMTDAATGLIVLHVNAAATAALDFALGNPRGTAHGVLVEIVGTDKLALIDDSDWTFRLRGKYYV